MLELRAEASELLGAPKILARLENRQDDQPILLIFRPNLRELPITQKYEHFYAKSSKNFGKLVQSGAKIRDLFCRVSSTIVPYFGPFYNKLYNVIKVSTNVGQRSKGSKIDPLF